MAQVLSYEKVSRGIGPEDHRNKASPCKNFRLTDTRLNFGLFDLTKSIGHHRISLLKRIIKNMHHCQRWTTTNDALSSLETFHSLEGHPNTIGQQQHGKF